MHNKQIGNMKKVLVIPFLFLAFNLFSQDTTYYGSDWKETERVNAEFYRVLTKVDSLWKIEDYYIDNRLQMTGFLNKPVHTSRHGEFKWYYENGNLNQTGQYKNGKPHGKLEFFYEDGKLESFSYYKNGALDGSFSSFHTDGQITAKGEYIDGKLNGIAEFWFPNGLLKSHSEFENGKKVGKWQYYDETGNLIEELLYYQKYEIIENKLVFEIPNQEWFRNKLVDNKRFIWHSFKRNPIKNKNGTNIFPNISFLVEEIGDLTDVIIFSMQKRQSMPFDVDSVYSHDGSNLRLKNAVGYLGKSHYEDGSIHTVLIVHAIVDKKGVQIVMDMTSDLFEKYGNEFWSSLNGIYEIE